MIGKVVYAKRASSLSGQFQVDDGGATGCCFNSIQAIPLFSMTSSRESILYAAGLA